MPPAPTHRATEGREDISRFVVHLTRDDRKTFPQGGSSARENFLSIVNGRKIVAYSPHCLHSRSLSQLSEEVQKRLEVACFTEVPLNQLHLLCQVIPGRSIKLDSFGFVFSKEFFANAGGQPAIYVNSYGENSWYREAFDELFALVKSDGENASLLWRILPFLNAMHERCDFSWEREWRIRGKLRFKLSDVVAIVLPANGEEDLKEQFAGAGVAVISPGWTYEQIVAELARQQRTTKKLVLANAQESPKTKS